MKRTMNSVVMSNETIIKGFSFLNTGYYLALSVDAPECSFTSKQSAAYKTCIKACQDIDFVFGTTLSCKMTHNLSERNAKSYLRYADFIQSSPIPQCDSISNSHRYNPYDLRTRYHITLIDPKEYSSLKSKSKLDTVVKQFSLVDLTSLIDYFDSLLIFSYQNDLPIGIVRGDITMPVEEGDKSLNGEILNQYSTAVYLLLDVSKVAALTEMSNIRKQYVADITDTDGGSNIDNNWYPHVTLAFTHNDIHTKHDKSEGVAHFQQLRHKSSKDQIEIF